MLDPVEPRNRTSAAKSWSELSTSSRLVIGIAAVAFVLYVVTGIIQAVNSDAAEPDTQPAPQATTPPPTQGQGVYDNLPFEYGSIIPAETDCELLQEIFDVADNAHSGRIDAGDLDGARAFTRVMTAADHRMEQVGCYG
ncbi:MAG: hypothetical protein WD269_12225 [Acidimicrobiia bacterium]